MIDAFIVKGLSEAFRTLMDVAKFDETSIFQVMSKMFHDLSNVKSFSNWSCQHRSDLAPNKLTYKQLDVDATRLLDNVFKSVKLPGRKSRLMAIYHEIFTTSEIRNNIQQDDYHIVTPFLSEQVILAVASTASFFSVKDGFDRYIERKIAQNFTSPEIYNKTEKYGGEDHVLRQLIDEKEALRELISNGQLYRMRLIEGDVVETNLDVSYDKSTAAIDLINIISCEIWVREQIKRKTLKPLD